MSAPASVAPQSRACPVLPCPVPGRVAPASDGWHLESVGQAGGDKFSQVLGAVEMFTGDLMAKGGLAVTLATGGVGAEAGAPAVGLGMVTAAHGAIVATSATLHMSANHSSSGGGSDEEESPDPTVTTLQSGGHTVTDATARKLNQIHGTDLHTRDWGRALEALKSSEGLEPKHHGKIRSDGTYVSKVTGATLGNLLDFVPGRGPR